MEGKWFFFLLSFVFFLPTPLLARNPIGEIAHYELDKDSDRTSKIVKEGTAVAEIVGFLSAKGFMSYRMEFNYDLKMKVLGHQKGKRTLDIDEQYFTENFIEELRTGKIFEAGDFKVQHVGYGDASTMNGKFYPNCDKLLFYEINTGFAGDPLEIIAHISYGIPVLGAVKIDAKGKYGGMELKMGADLMD